MNVLCRGFFLKYIYDDVLGTNCDGDRDPLTHIYNNHDDEAPNRLR